MKKEIFELIQQAKLKDENYNSIIVRKMDEIYEIQLHNYHLKWNLSSTCRRQPGYPMTSASFPGGYPPSLVNSSALSRYGHPGIFAPHGVPHPGMPHPSLMSPSSIKQEGGQHPDR